MVIEWSGNAIDCRHLILKPGYLRPGDFIVLGGQLLKLITVQNNCPRLENLSKKFTMFTCRTPSGATVPARELNSTVECYRPKRAK